MKPQAGLPHSYQSERGRKRAGPNASALPLILVPESALGSHPCVALSSAQANDIITRTIPWKYKG
jgi:hypothetical protein